MTAAQAQKMREARARAGAIRQRDEERAAGEYVGWVCEEAQSYAEVCAARERYDADAEIRAYKQWRVIMSECPPRPGDAAFRRLRGEL